MTPKTWNENQGVTVWADEGGQVYATPIPEWSRGLITAEEFKKDEGIGVPALSNLDVWGDEARRSGMGSFNEWVALVQKRQGHARADAGHEGGKNAA